MTDRYSITERESGLLVAGPAVGVRPGELWEMPEDSEAEAKPLPPVNTVAVASKTVPARRRR
jgi:hypothetical protein